MPPMMVNERRFDGSILRALREKNGRSRTYLAGMIGVTAESVRGWEEKGYSPSSQALSALATFFNVPMESFFRRRPKEKRP